MCVFFLARFFQFILFTEVSHINWSFWICNFFHLTDRIIFQKIKNSYFNKFTFFFRQFSSPPSRINWSCALVTLSARILFGYFLIALYSPRIFLWALRLVLLVRARIQNEPRASRVGYRGEMEHLSFGISPDTEFLVSCIKCRTAWRVEDFAPPSIFMAVACVHLSLSCSHVCYRTSTCIVSSTVHSWQIYEQQNCAKFHVIRPLYASHSYFFFTIYSSLVYLFHFIFVGFSIRVSFQLYQN